MLRTEAYASELGTLSDARRLFGNVARGTTSLRGRRLKGKGKGERNARTGAREEGGKEGNASFLLSLLARPGFRVPLAPKTPFPFPFKRLPRRLGEYDTR